MEHQTADEWRRVVEALAARFEARFEALEDRFQKEVGAREALLEEAETLRRAVIQLPVPGHLQSQAASAAAERPGGNAVDMINSCPDAQEPRGDMEMEGARSAPDTPMSPEDERPVGSVQSNASDTTASVDGGRLTDGGSPDTLGTPRNTSQSLHPQEAGTSARVSGRADSEYQAADRSDDRLRVQAKDTKGNRATNGGGGDTKRRDRGNTNAGTQGGKEVGPTGTQSVASNKGVGPTGTQSVASNLRRKSPSL
ncbi:hypothetical protein HPB48_025142 [Haemaphysalis longicornis]|uniref:Uncharacterized protein n=1 Tax=Haemaphysalis longicornis TaxID=44386 RepID=A0A9J6H738_HAELO|nr:hypothetical protein HPB48_025142 [Haemaphysalis longicornis]